MRRVSCALFGLLVLTLGLAGCGGGSSGSGSTGGGGPTATAMHPPFRNRYLRTDTLYDPNALQFFPPHFTAYDQVHKRFFVSNPARNRVDVFDAANESQLGSIIVPQAFGLDVSTDGTKLYVATAFGDVYLIDPGSMQITQRYPSATLGPQGYVATQALILADGRVVLMGALGGYYLDGSMSFAVWDPVSNTLQQVQANALLSYGQIALSGDRTKVLVGGASIQQLMLYDPGTGSSTLSQFTGGFIVNILPTPDGKRFIVLGSAGDEVFDASTLAAQGSFQTPCSFSSAVLSYDGSTLFCADFTGNVLAYDSTSFTQKGWIPDFNVLDLQDHIVLSAADPTGLIVGPIGHGVAFLDSQQLKSGTAGTALSVSFLAPPSGPPGKGTTVQANYNTVVGVNLTSATVYVGNGKATNVSISPVTISATTPPASFAGPADFAVVLPDGSMDMMPEDFSFGPTIVEVSTNAASAEGGAQGVIFGYGLGQQPSDVQVSVGGQAAQVTQVFPYQAFGFPPIFPYPFPINAVLFSIPPGTAGTSATVTVTTANGSANASNAFNYVSAVQAYPLAGASLMQGIYDPTRRLLYFTDQNRIDVFSPAAHAWQGPIPISYTNAASSLVGIALSPDGNTLAVSDSGNNRIYVLNPSSPNSAKSFYVNTGTDVQPYGLAVTNAGAVYYATHDQNIDPAGGFNKLDTTTGVITNFAPVKNGDQFVRVLLAPDGSRVYVNDGPGNAGIWLVDTSNDSLTEALQATLAGDGNEDAALSGDGSTLLGYDLVTDSNANVSSALSYVDRDVWFPLSVYGQKLSADGSRIFQPLTDGVDVLDSASGLLQYRVALPLQIASVFDGLALDNDDNLIFAITSNGIVQLDLHALPASRSSYRNQRVPIAALRASRSAVPRRSPLPGRKNLVSTPGLRPMKPHLRREAGVAP
jgi:hypothetical protein